jgi:hypothetical protein
MKKPQKLQGRLITSPVDVHNNYDYEYKSVNTHDQFSFKRGKEIVSVALAHPHIPTLQESDPRHNAEWIRGTGTFEGREQYQHTLWNEPHRAAHPPTVTGLFATPGARSDVATALGVVAQHSMERFGQIPRSSQDLSPQSQPIASRLMHTLKEKGIEGVNSYVPHNARNEISKEDGAKAAIDSSRNYYGKDAHKDVKTISEKEIHSGSQLMRGIFSGRHLSKKQFHQDELPL